MNYISIPGIKEQYRSQCAPVITSEGIIKTVCDHLDVRFDDLKTKCRIREYVHARHIIFYFLKKHTSLTLKSMGEIFNRDHTTVIHGLENLNDIIATEQTVKADIE